MFVNALTTAFRVTFLAAGFLFVLVDRRRPTVRRLRNPYRFRTPPVVRGFRLLNTPRLVRLTYRFANFRDDGMVRKCRSDTLVPQPLRDRSNKVLY